MCLSASAGTGESCSALTTGARCEARLAIRPHQTGHESAIPLGQESAASAFALRSDSQQQRKPVVRLGPQGVSPDLHRALGSSSSLQARPLRPIRPIDRPGSGHVRSARRARPGPALNVAFCSQETGSLIARTAEPLCALVCGRRCGAAGTAK